MISWRDHEGSLHVGMKATIILDRPGFLQNQRHRLLWRHGHVEVTVPRRRGMGEHVLVYPFDVSPTFLRSLGARNCWLWFADTCHERVRSIRMGSAITVTGYTLDAQRMSCVLVDRSS